MFELITSLAIIISCIIIWITWGRIESSLRLHNLRLDVSSQAQMSLYNGSEDEISEKMKMGSDGNGV